MPENYNPKQHLKPYDMPQVVREVPLNSLHSTRIFNRRQAAQSLAKLPTLTNSLVQVDGLAKEVKKTDFMESRSSSQFK